MAATVHLFSMKDGRTGSQGAIVLEGHVQCTTIFVVRLPCAETGGLPINSEGNPVHLEHGE